MSVSHKVPTPLRKRVVTACMRLSVSVHGRSDCVLVFRVVGGSWRKRCDVRTSPQQGASPFFYSLGGQQGLEPSATRRAAWRAGRFHLQHTSIYIQVLSVSLTREK